jgi:hypothetical protein
MSHFKELYERLLKEESFRKELLEDPAATLRKFNIVRTPEVLEAVCGIIKDVKILQKELGARKGEMETCVS